MSATSRLPLLEESDLPDLPEGWLWTRVLNLGVSGTETVKTGPFGAILKSKEFVSSGVPILAVGNVQSGRLELKNVRVDHVTEAKAVALSDYRVQAGDVLFTRSGTIGRSAVVPLSAQGWLMSYHLLRVRPDQRVINPQYMYFVFSGCEVSRQHTNDSVIGTTRPGINTRILEGLPVPLPPRAEQERIVEKVELLLACVNAARERLNRVSVILKRFRLAVLTAAFSGRLTEDWEKTCLAAESADEFLNRVAVGIDEDENQESDSGDDSPVGWASCSFARLFSVETGATPSRKTPHYYQHATIPWVKTGEVQNCDIFHTEESITPLAIAESNAKIFPSGTILIAMYGEGRTRGQVARLRIDAATNQACAALVNTDLPPGTNAYVYYYCLGQYSKFREKAFGGNQPNLNLGLIKRWRISIPTEREQREIVRRIEALFALADAIEKRVVAATTCSERLTHAILAKAFRGELVPTEAELARREGRSYETASAFLNRIREPRAAPTSPRASSDGVHRGRRKRA